MKLEIGSKYQTMCMKKIPSVNLQIASVSSFESLNKPSFSKRLRIIQALASASPNTELVSIAMVAFRNVLLLVLYLASGTLE